MSAELEEARTRARIAAHVATQATEHEARTRALLRGVRASLLHARINEGASFVARSLGFGALVWPIERTKEK